MDEIYTYLVPLPDGVREMITPCADGYTVYIDAGLDEGERMAAYKHAIWHVSNSDFEKSRVQEVEYYAHMREKER